MSGTLAARCRQLVAIAEQADAWLQQSGTVAVDDRPSVERALRRLGREARRLADAAERSMCVAVFGPSQSGKSYLISTLARRGTEPPHVVLGGRRIDFVAEINPQGGKESTGLVTRFTVRPEPGLAGQPVVLRLLTQADVVRIIANGFMEDVLRDAVLPPGDETIRELLDTFKLTGTAGAGGLVEADVEDLREYFDEYFRSHPTVNSLGSHYWQEAARLAPRLAPASRARLFSPLWGQIEPLTTLCQRLLEGLAALGNPEEAFCGIDALLPRTSSIIDVQMLDDLGNPAASQIEVGTRAGLRTTLPRPVLAALVAELRLTLAEQPFPFLNHTDLLDFPGARARETITDPRGFLGQPDKLSALLLRGKVAYLYQRYVTEKEMTAMLLCIGDGPQEVRTLPGMVKKWIDSTHGATAAERAALPTSLLLVLTKFDKEFEEKIGQQEPSWSTRLENALTKFLCLEFDWHLNWSPGQSFRNSFWLRNPNAINKGLMDYQGVREVGLREPERLGKLRQKFISTPEVIRHFANPGRAWDEAFKFNDGGVNYLADSLEPLCNPETKNRQVMERFGRLAKDLIQQLERHYISGDRSQEAKKRVAEARELIERLPALGRRQRLGLLLRRLQLPAGSLHGRFYGLLRTSLLGQGLDEREVSDALARTFGFDKPAVETNVDQPANIFEAYAHAAIDEWTQRMHALAADHHLEATFGLARPLGAVLVRVLSEAARRIGLRDAIAHGIAEHYANIGDAWSRVRMPALIAEEMINAFVEDLGFAAMGLADRPTAEHPGLGRLPIFAPQTNFEGLPPLGETRSAYESDYLIDWCVGFVKLAELNAGVADDRANAPANRRLGDLLVALQHI